MAYGERLHDEVSDCDFVALTEHSAVVARYLGGDTDIAVDTVEDSLRSVDGEVVFLCQYTDVFDVVGMGVGDEYAVNMAKVDTVVFADLLDRTYTYSRIDKKTSTLIPTTLRASRCLKTPPLVPSTVLVPRMALS